MDRFDYVVVGGGSAGCAAAARLCQDIPDARVLLVECGLPAESNPETLRADGYKDAFVNDRVIWERYSEAQASCANRQLFAGTGRGLGGSGSVNAMVYLRGSEADYRSWPADGWRWPDLVPDFAKLEQALVLNRRSPTEFTEACIEGARSAGFRRKEDLNDGDLCGVLGYESMNYRGNERRSSYVALLKPEMGANHRLVVHTSARARRVVFDSSRRARGIELDHLGTRQTIHAEREVILCAGALETPKLLMLSGIGAAEQLRSHGIEVVADLPGVGENFHDHPNITLFYRGNREVDCNYPQLYGFHRANHDSTLPADQADSCYVFYPARSSLREALMRLLPSMVLPPTLRDNRAVAGLLRKGVQTAFASRHVRDAVARLYGIVAILGKPKSRGSVRLRSGDVRDQLAIDPAYLREPEDLETMYRSVQLVRDIAGSGALARWGNLELFPGRWVQSRPRLERFIRANAITTYHFAGTCKMGRSDDSVVDSRLRVRGVEGLRVADASVMPEVPVSALNAPSMLIGYRAAGFAAQDATQNT